MSSTLYSMDLFDTPTRRVVHDVGHAMGVIPNAYAMDEDQTACCVATECYACAWILDVFGTLPTLWAIEPPENHDKLSVFSKYELTWPCRMCLFPFSNEARRAEYRCCTPCTLDCCGCEISLRYPLPYRTNANEDSDTRPRNRMVS